MVDSANRTPRMRALNRMAARALQSRPECDPGRLQFLNVDSIGVPRRDLNPCYRRKRDSRIRKLLKPEDADGYQSPSKEPKGTLIGRQSDAKINHAAAVMESFADLPCSAD